MTRRRRRASWTIEEAGIRVRIFPRGANKTYWLDVRKDRGVRVRVSAGTVDASRADTAARELAKEIARQELLGVTQSNLTLAVLLTAYHEHKGRTLEGQWRKRSDSRIRTFTQAWGAHTYVASISQTSVDTFCEDRRRAWAVKETARVEKNGASSKPPRPLRDGALDSDFRWLSSVFNWAVKHKLPNGQRLLDRNPLHDCHWPREKNVRRPVASHERYQRTLARACDVDPSGRFRLALVLARNTGRRIDAIMHLRLSDILLSTERLKAAIAAAGLDERIAEHMPHGAIRWRDEHDKQGVERITPISPEVRAEIETYIAANPRVGDMPLLPATATRSDGPRARTIAPKKLDTVLSRHNATKWLEKAELLAGLPKLARGGWHAYRRLWATERKHLPDVDVAEAGGWNGTKAMKLAYQHATPDGVAAAVLGIRSA